MTEQRCADHSTPINLKNSSNLSVESLSMAKALLPIKNLKNGKFEDEREVLRETSTILLYKPKSDSLFKPQAISTHF